MLILSSFWNWYIELQWTPTHDSFNHDPFYLALRALSLSLFSSSFISNLHRTARERVRSGIHTRGSACVDSRLTEKCFQGSERGVVSRTTTYKAFPLRFMQCGTLRCDALYRTHTVAHSIIDSLLDRKKKRKNAG